MSGAEEEAECRICGDLVPTSELVEPCGCRGGMRWAHSTCVQTWISTDKGPGRRNDSCEVCGEAWVGEYDVPEPSVQSPEEYAHRMHVLLSSAYVRVMMDVPRAHDEHLLEASRTASSGAVAGVVTARRGQETERVRPMEGARGEGDVPGRPAERRVRRGQALPGVARRKEDRESKCDVRMRMFRTGDGGRRRRGWDETRPARRGRRDARNPARPTPIGYRCD